MVRGRRKSCVARPREEGRHEVSKIRRAVDANIVVKDSKRCNIVAMRKKMKTVRGDNLIRRQDFYFNMSKRTI